MSRDQCVGGYQAGHTSHTVVLKQHGTIVLVPMNIRRNTEQVHEPDGPTCHGPCRARIAPDRLAGYAYVRP